MFRRSSVGATVLFFAALVASTLAKAGDKPFFFVNDNWLTYAYRFNATSPGASADTGKHFPTFTHFDVWAYGTNFFFLETRQSVGNSDPAGPCIPTVGVANKCAGTLEFYGLLRSSFGFNEILGAKTFSYGPLQNVSLLVGVDAEVANQFLAPAKKNIVAGVRFSFALPYEGYLNVAPLYYKEWNHNTFLTPNFVGNGCASLTGACAGISDGNTDYRGTWGLEVQYNMDLGFLPRNMQYFAVSGFLSLYGPKGAGAGPLQVQSFNKTATEVLSEPLRFSFNASKLIMGDEYSHLVELWVSYRYWQNKFGINDSNPNNPVCFSNAGTQFASNNGTCTEKTLFTGVSVKF